MWRRRRDVEGPAVAAGGLERLQPDLEGEVRYFAAKLAANGIPNRLELVRHGLANGLRWGRFGVMVWGGDFRGVRSAVKSLGNAESTPGTTRRSTRFFDSPQIATKGCSQLVDSLDALPSATSGEAHVSAQETQAGPHSWVPRAHAHARRASDPRAPPPQGPQAADALGEGPGARAAAQGAAAQALAQRRVRSGLSRGPLAREPPPCAPLLPASGRRATAPGSASRSGERWAARWSGTG